MSGMRWDCSKTGCFNVKCRPKIQVFDDCFRGKIRMGDVDGIVEMGGHFLMLEWKSKHRAMLDIGQRIMYERITRSDRFTVIVVCGSAETMEVTSYCVYSGGKCSEWVDGGLADVRAWIKNWSSGK